MLVVGVTGEHRVAGRHRAREPDLANAPFGLARWRTCTCAPTTAQPSPRESGSKCMSVRRRPNASPIRRPVCSSRSNRKSSRGRRQHASTASTCSPVSASGNGVSARAFNARARTLRNWPDSPTSNPGGVKRSHRGSDNRSATAASINPVRAQNRSSSHTRSGSR